MPFFQHDQSRLVLLLDKDCPKNKTQKWRLVSFSRLALRLLVYR
jgi:hypothetical protein